MTALVDLRDVGKAYVRGTREVVALREVTLQIEEGESVAITGPSGSGKSTLLSILGCLDRPTTGEYRLGGTPVAGLGDEQLSRVRNRSIGFVFQSFHLIPQLTVAENVETPLLYAGVSPARWRERALSCLERVGLLPRADHRPSELSGGEAQRAAIARAGHGAAPDPGRRADGQPRQHHGRGDRAPPGGPAPRRAHGRVRDARRPRRRGRGYAGRQGRGCNSGHR